MQKNSAESVVSPVEGGSGVTENFLTITHTVMGAVIAIGGVLFAKSIEFESPRGALLCLVGAVVLPSLVFTQVAWNRGFAAGRNSAHDKPTET